jgi:plasmid stabilization system protein ParE
MEYDINYNPEAEADLEEILLYLSRFYPDTPKKFDEAFQKKADMLRRNPHTAHYEYNPIFRKVNVKGYLAFFTIDEDARAVTIHHVRYGRRRPWEDGGA